MYLQCLQVEKGEKQDYFSLLLWESNTVHIPSPASSLRVEGLYKNNGIYWG